MRDFTDVTSMFALDFPAARACLRANSLAWVGIVFSVTGRGFFDLPWLREVVLFVFTRRRGFVRWLVRIEENQGANGHEQQTDHGKEDLYLIVLAAPARNAICGCGCCALSFFGADLGSCVGINNDFSGGHREWSGCRVFS